MSEGLNPKDLVGAKKAPLGLVPPALYIGAAEAMLIGAQKYDPFNWRAQPIQFMTYIEAMFRHLFALVDGQDFAEDTGVHHLKHVLAGGGILLDAIESGRVVDNRPMKGPAADMLRAQDKSVTDALRLGVNNPEAAMRALGYSDAAIDAAARRLADGTEGGDVLPDDRHDCDDDCQGTLHDPVMGLA